MWETTTGCSSSMGEGGSAQAGVICLHMRGIGIPAKKGSMVAGGGVSCEDRSSCLASVGKGKCLGEETSCSQIFLPGSTWQLWLQGPGRG